MNVEYIENLVDRIWSAPGGELVGGLLSSSVVCAVLAVVVTGATLLLRRRRGRTLLEAPRDEYLAVAAAALGVGVIWFADVVVRGYVLDLSAAVAWWRFATAPVVAAIALCALGSALRTRHPRPRIDAGTAGRRTWRTFGPGRLALSAFLVSTCLVVVVVVVCATMATATEPGSSAHIALGIPNTDERPLIFPFPGWAYGTPLLVALVALTVALLFALRRNAIRPYPAGRSAESERAHRSMIARDVVTIATAGALLSLAGILRVASSAVASSITVSAPDRAETTLAVSVPHLDLFVVGGLMAPVLEIAGCAMLTALLLHVGLGLRRVEPTSAVPVGAA